MAHKIKSVIFDLDDTLFDTYSQLVGPASREACEAMIEKGLKCTVEECIEKRSALQKENLRSNVYTQIVDFFGAAEQKSEDEISQAGRVAFHRRRIKEDIQLFPRTLECLSKIKGEFRIFLVTLGDPETQQTKVRLLGLEKIFENVFYVDIHSQETKKTTFKKIQELTGFKSEEIVSIGNRIDTDIRFAKELGFKGVLFEHGEYLHLVPETAAEIPDQRVKNLGEFVTWLNS